MLAVLGLGWLLNTKHYHKVLEEIRSNHHFLYLMGIVEITAGIALVLAHNVWTWEWSILITLLGWGAIIEGGLGLLFPNFIADAARSYFKKDPFFQGVGVLTFLLGLVLVYFGYFA